MDNKLTHLDEQGNPAMVDVGQKSASGRMARAEAIVEVTQEIMALMEGGELRSKKGPVFQTAIIAGIMAAKQTGNLIPLCHPIGLDRCDVHIEVIGEARIRVQCTAALTAKTGVEMEALTGASIAALTIYDMCKALSHDITISSIRLMEKRGGKRDFLRAE
jgi:cyclic pyranopterin phosphate synthase